MFNIEIIKLDRSSILFPNLMLRIFNVEIIPKVKLMPEAQPRCTNVPSGIISISQFKINIVSSQGTAEGY